MRERDYEVKGQVLADGSGKKTAKYIRFKALGYELKRRDPELSNSKPRLVVPALYSVVSTIV